MIEPNVGKRMEHDDRAQKARECHGTTCTGLLRTTRDERRSFDRRCGGRGVATFSRIMIIIPNIIGSLLRILDHL